MKNIFLLLIVLFALHGASAHNSLKGKVMNISTREPLSDVLVQIANGNKITFTDAGGNFSFDGLRGGTYYLYTTSLGYKPRMDTVVLKDGTAPSLSIFLYEENVRIKDVVIVARNDNGSNVVSAVDFKLRPHLTTQDLLRLVPGLFIAQHAGGGKAESLLLRGFDVDHGTDVAISVDNMPVNMVSQAHGQGYADLHFVIPETIEKMNFSKGPYDAKTGDFNTAGAVRFQTKSYLPQNMVKLEAGRFNTMRGVTMLNLLNNGDTSGHRQNAYVAAEYYYTRGFFQNPQDFSKLNLFGKYTAELNNSTNLAFTISSFNSKWNASGEIPDRAVAKGLISKYGSLDPSEGGNTSRYNANLTLNKKLDEHSSIQSNMYYIKYNYNLYSNFSFFKNDSINGDEINQYESRNTFGYNGSYTRASELGSIDVKSTIGIGLRDDEIGTIGLASARKRNFIKDITKGEIHETSFSAYLDENFYFSPRLSINIGLRFDNFHFAYRNRLVDTINDFNARTASIVSPKFNVFYNVTRNFQLYVSAGSGFHSNDARVAVQAAGITLPRALSADLGTNLKIGNKLFINAALWWMTLQSEYVWSGDEGLFEPSGKTRRVGIDLSARYQILSWLFADGDLNLANPKYVNEPEGHNYVPVAPPITSIAGLNVRTKNGFTASIRYRYLGARPLIEDNSVRAQAYFLLDAVIGYTQKKYQLGFTAENLLNRYWKEAQYGTESQLHGEPAPVTEVHYTPGTPFNLRAYCTLFF